ncbi:MAG: metallophosphoesterase [Rhodospirillaceae bacterium]
MAARIAIFLGILTLLNAYAAWRVIARWPWAEAHLAIAWFVALLFFLLQLVGPFGDRLWFPAWKKRGADALVHVLSWISSLAFGAMSVTVVYALATDILGVVWQLIALPVDAAGFNRGLLLILSGATLATLVVGVWQARSGPGVRTVEVPLAALPARFDGFKIVQISDLHVGPTIGRGYVRNVVEMANALAPDLVALTGDFADGKAADVADEIAPLAGLRAPEGVFFVTGNHEYFWDAAAWMAMFRKLGARVLVNEHTLIRRESDAIILAGVTDYSTRSLGPPHGSDPAAALAGAPRGTARILLAHQPASYEAASAAGFDLQLSGHTHSGQYFPFNLMIRFFQRYYRGLNRHGDMWVYVNRGTGYWGPRLRAGVPSEITLLVLRRKP